MCAVLGNKLPFAGSQNKPKCQQYANRYEIMATCLLIILVLTDEHHAMTRDI